MTTVRVIEIDRWGRFLVADAGDGPWRLPAGEVRPDESPDAAAIRVFEALTGEVLDDLRLYPARDGAVSGHVYYFDADLDAALLGANPVRFHRLGPADLASAPLTGEDRSLLDEFAASTRYRAMFH